MKLLVVRHAIAMSREEYHGSAVTRATARIAAPVITADKNDDFRPLTIDGIRKMKKNVRGLSELVKTPDFLATSPLTRAQQTAEILRTVWPELEPVECDALRPTAGMGDFIVWFARLKHLADRDSLLAIVGHEPHLSRLVSWLLVGAEDSILELKKGGACLLEFDKVPEKGEGRLLWLAGPAILRSLRD